MTITLEPQTYQVFQARVDSGRYASIQEAIEAGARLLQEQEAQEQAELESLRRLLEVGAQELSRGESITYRSGKEMAEQVKAAGKLRLQGSKTP